MLNLNYNKERHLELFKLKYFHEKDLSSTEKSEEFCDFINEIVFESDSGAFS